MRSRKRSPKRGTVCSMRRMSIRSEPMPMIICRQSRSGRPGAQTARLVHQGPHAPDGAVEAAEDRLADQEMADVELDDGRDRRHWADAVIGQTVAGMAFQEIGRASCRERVCQYV